MRGGKKWKNNRKENKKGKIKGNALYLPKKFFNFNNFGQLERKKINKN